MSDQHRSVMIWVTLNYDPHKARFLRQKVWLHHDGQWLNRSWGLAVLAEKAEPGTPPDFNAVQFAALFHLRKSRLLFESQSLEAQNVENGDTFYLFLDEPSSIIEDMKGYFTAADFPKKFDINIPEHVASVSWEEIFEYKKKANMAPSATTNNINIRDIIGSNVPILSNLTGARQTIGSISGANEEQKEKLNGLLGKLQVEVLKAPKDRESQAEALTEFAKQLVSQAAQPKPNPTMLQMVGQSMRNTAEFLKDAVPAIATISANMASLIGEIHGISL